MHEEDHLKGHIRIWAMRFQIRDMGWFSISNAEKI